MNNNSTSKDAMLIGYIDYLFQSNIPYGIISIYIKGAMSFIQSGYDINKSGYVKYCRNNTLLLVSSPLMKKGILSFLDWRGIGYKRKKHKQDENIKPLEKLSDISERNKKLMSEYFYWLECNRDYSNCTLRIYKTGISQFFEYANEFSFENCKRFIKMLETEKHAKPATICCKISALEQFSKFLKKPVELSRPKFQRKLSTENVPTKEDYEKLLGYLKTLKNKSYYFYVRILATTGARISEFSQMTWEDIINGDVTLRCKGNKYRRIFFQKSLQEEVRVYVSETGVSGLVAINKFGLPMSSRNLPGLMKKWAEKCGIDPSKMHPHAFRHFFAKMYLQKNKDVVQLADILGHSSINTTKIYLQKNYDEQKRDFNKNVTW